MRSFWPTLVLRYGNFILYYITIYININSNSDSISCWEIILTKCLCCAVCCSYNADMLPDLLAETTPGLWTIYIADVKHNFVPLEKPLIRSPLAFSHSGAFISLLEDDKAEYAAGSVVASFEYYFVCSAELRTCRASWGRPHSRFHG